MSESDIISAALQMLVCVMLFGILGFAAGYFLRARVHGPEDGLETFVAAMGFGLLGAALGAIVGAFVGLVVAIVARRLFR
jgi:hypothetical protein